MFLLAVNASFSFEEKEFSTKFSDSTDAKLIFIGRIVQIS